MDLANLNLTAAADQGAEIELRHPIDQSGLGVFVSILGSESTTFREAVRESVNSKLRREALNARRGKAGQDVPTVEQGEEEAIKLLAACTLGWRTVVKDAKGKPDPAASGSFIAYEGAKLEFNIPNALRLYTELGWMRKQVDEAMGDLGLFMKG